MNKIYPLPLLLIFLIFFSCGEERAKSKQGILSEQKMTELLVDTHLADAVLYIDNSRSDEKRDKALFYYPSVLEKYGITKAQMDSSVVWYMKNPDAYTRVYAAVVKELQDMQKETKPVVDKE